MTAKNLELFDQDEQELDRPRVREVSLLEETEKRYLNYALSVITSRALPDVRDGLKPVQRRILYAMYHDLKLLPTARFRKSAAVVGETMGKYHPHGDQAIYDTMVRMAQPFSLRSPLVDGYGNFGSIDGDKAAAFRYTEARLQPISLELLDELNKDTVDFKDNFDGTQQEPVVLPSRFPHLLVNGAAGIAVGMATNIPPHNFGEVMDALLLLLDQPQATTKQIIRKLKGPDFPTGGEIITRRRDRIKIYDTGQGSITMRGEWKEEKLRGKTKKKQKRIIITSIPYNVNKSTLVEKIADVVISKKLPMLLDVRDESTEDIRIVLELKSNSDFELVMAYLYKETPLQQRFNVNMTCLVPTPNPFVAAPERLPIKKVLEQFLAFRTEVLERRYRHELANLQRRIHLLVGFALIFDDLDEAIRIIRNSDGRADSCVKLKKRFGLDDIQANAILDTRLYRISRLEIASIRKELAELRAKAEAIEKILSNRDLLLDELRKECKSLRVRYAEPRRTRLLEDAQPLELQPEDLIQEEDTNVILSRDGWIKRIRNFSDLQSIRTRDGDEVMAVLPGSTKETVCFLTNFGVAYTMRIWDVNATSGYGTPLQSLFKFQDGERVVAAFSFDPRICGDIGITESKGDEKAESSDEVPPAHLLIVTQQGFGSRLSLAPFAEPSTKTGRRFVRRGREDMVLDAFLCTSAEFLLLFSQKKRLLSFSAAEVKFLSSPGKGVKLIALDDDDLLLASALCRDKNDTLQIESEKGEVLTFTLDSNSKIGKRNSRGTTKRFKGGPARMIPPAPPIPSLKPEETEATTPEPTEPTPEPTEPTPEPADKGGEV